jgi:hypothetical protein
VPVTPGSPVLDQLLPTSSPLVSDPVPSSGTPHVTQHKDLDVLGGVGAGEQRQPPEHANQHLGWHGTVMVRANRGRSW